MRKISYMTITLILLLMGSTAHSARGDIITQILQDILDIRMQLSSLEDEVDENRALIQDLEDAVSSCQSDLSALGNDVENLTTSFTTFQADTIDEIEDLDSRVTALE